MSKKLLLSALIIGVMALVPLQAFAGISGSASSGVQVQNLDQAAAALITVQLYPQAGGNAVALTAAGGQTLGSGAAANFYLPSFTSLNPGAYSMVVSADKPMAAIARTDWAASGGAALYSNPTPGTDVIIPLVTKNFAGQTSQFTIQNTDTSANVTDVTIDVYGRGSSVPAVALTGQTIAAGASKTYNLSDATTFPNLGDTGTDLGATGFVGSIRVKSATKSLAVQSFIDIANTRAVTGFSGVPASAAASKLFCPLIRANYYGDTGISIVNPGNTQVTVVITYRADAGSPNQGTYTENVTVPANSSSVPFQGAGGSSRAAGLPGGSQTAGNPPPPITASMASPSCRPPAATSSPS